MLYHIKTKYIDDMGKLVWGKYPNNRDVLEIKSTFGNIIMRPSVNIPNVLIESDQIIIKDYSENEGILQCLMDHGIISAPLYEVNSGYTFCYVCNILKRN